MKLDSKMIWLALAMFGCDLETDEVVRVDQSLTGSWVRKTVSTDSRSARVWYYTFKFESDGKVVSDYWATDSAGNISPFHKNNAYVSDRYEIQSRDSIVFTIQKDVDSYRQIFSRYEVVGDSLFLWNRKELYWHVENGRYIRKSDDSEYVEEKVGYAVKSTSFEFH